MLKNTQTYVILNAAQVRAIVDSTNASPINVQATGHGFVTGDKITVTGHATNTAANGTWTVTKVNANNFTLDGSTGNGVGANTGCVAPAGKVIDTSDFQHIVFSIGTDGGGDAAMTVKFPGSNGKTMTDDTAPDFAKAQSVANLYDYLQTVDKQSGSTVSGDTGFVVATADNYVTYVANTDAVRWISAIPTAGTAGEISIKATLFNNI